MYTAAFLDDPSHHLLRWMTKYLIREDWFESFSFETDRNAPLCDHMTINMGKLDDLLNSSEILNQDCFLYVQSIVCSKTLGVCAAIVERAATINKKISIVTMNKVPHITIATRTGVPPKTSNQMFEQMLKNDDQIEIQLDQTYELKAHICYGQ